MRSNRPASTAIAAIAGMTLVAMPAAAMADTAAPGVSSSAWYWKDQRSQTVQDPSGTDVASAEAPNPFCPAAPGGLGAPEQTCRPGRLPVEVRGGDYDEPNMISAVAFDLTAAPFGSQVRKFTVSFLEADDRQSRPINAEGKRIKACLVTDFFGDGEARHYRERPKFRCSDSDPVARRGEVKGIDDTYRWTFDLSAYARRWISRGTPVTAIMLYPVEPKGANLAERANWRVVMAGPQERGGVKSSLVFTPAAVEDPFGGLEDDPGSFDDVDSGGASAGLEDDFADAMGDEPVESDSVPLEDAGEAEAREPSQDEQALPATASGPEEFAPPMPWYAWAALVAGIVAFSLVRSVVLEGSTGLRPDGVLAQIRKLNAERRGEPVPDAPGSGGAPHPRAAAVKPAPDTAASVAHALGALGRRITKRKG